MDVWSIRSQTEPATQPWSSGLLSSPLQLLLFCQLWNFISSTAQENKSKALGHKKDTLILKVNLLSINMHYSTCNEKCQKEQLILPITCAALYRWFLHMEENLCPSHPFTQARHTKPGTASHLPMVPVSSRSSSTYIASVPVIQSLFGLV